MKFVSLSLLLLVSNTALGAVPTDNAFNEIVYAYRDASSTWEPVIKTYAFRLFWLLVAIDFSWGAIKLATQNSEFDSVIGFVVNRIMTIGFFLALIQFGSSWGGTIVDSLRQLAGSAGGVTKIDPSGLMDLGLGLAVKILKPLTITSPSSLIIGGLIGLGIFVLFALIAVHLLLLLIHLWVVLYAGVFWLAFGGSSWTHYLAVNYYKALLGIGARLFILQLIIGTGLKVIEKWTQALSSSSDPKLAELLVIAGAALILYVLVKGVDEIVSSLVNGSIGASASSGVAAAVGAATAAATVASAGAGAATNTTKSTLGVGQAISAASQLAKAEGATGMMSMTTQTAGNLAKSFGTDFSNKVSGDMSSHHGTTGGRMANIMKDQMAENRAKNAASSSDIETGNYISGVPSSDANSKSEV